MMHDHEKSDSAIVAVKPTNKAGQPAAELVEPRAGPEGREVQPAQRNLFDCAKRRPFSDGIAQDPSMFEAITVFLIVLSVGILVAHALDALRR